MFWHKEGRKVNRLTTRRQSSIKLNNNNNKKKKKKALNKDSYHTDRLISLQERGCVDIYGTFVTKL
jgi:hypothetical protein